MLRGETGRPRPLFPWLPAAARPLGVALATVGAAFEYAVLARGVHPSFLEVRVFALHAHYFESKNLTFFQKNVAFELATLLLVSGLFLMTFSRVATETEESERVRIRSILWALAAGTALLVGATLTLFGLSFAYALAAHAVLTLALAFVLAATSRARRRGSARPKEGGP